MKMNLLQIRKYRKSAKYDLVLNIELKETLIGLMLGDLFAERIKISSNTRLQFKQSIKNKDYIDHLYTLFESYCSTPPKVNILKDNRPEKKEFNESIKFWTLSLPCFNQFRELFYNDKGIKHIPLNLESLLSPRALAYWAMDDGYKSNNGFYFCTESYTLEDNLRLIKILKIKFGLMCGIHKHTNGHRLYVLSKSRDRLFTLIRPYMIDHFLYKITI
jgi:hypothetical protein